MRIHIEIHTFQYHFHSLVNTSIVSTNIRDSMSEVRLSAIVFVAREHSKIIYDSVLCASIVCAGGKQQVRRMNFKRAFIPFQGN